MSIIERKFATVQTSASVDAGYNVELSYYVCDTEPEKPSEGLNLGDLCMVLSSGRLYRATSNNTWIDPSVAVDELGVVLTPYAVETETRRLFRQLGRHLLSLGFKLTPDILADLSKES